MADDTIQSRIYYVYALYRPDGSPFYVGMGKGNRWLQHEAHAHRRASHKNHLIVQMKRSGITEIPKAKLHQNLTKEEAIAIEIEIIKSIGRSPDGPLLNATDGGEGILGLSKESLAARSAAIAAALQRPETKAKLSAASKGRVYGPRSEEFRRRLSIAVSGFRHTDEARAKIAAAGTGRAWTDQQREHFIASRSGIPMPPHVKAALQKANTGRVKNPEEIEKRVTKLRGRKHTPEAIANLKKGQSNRSNETKARIADAATAAWARSPERSITQSETSKAIWADPEKRSRNIASLKASWTPERKKKASEKAKAQRARELISRTPIGE